MAASDTENGPLQGVKVLDLSRILAGPTCTQLLGDLGASILKIENPLTGGDDTRQWGPPYVPDANGQDSDLSAYFMAANRNKRSVAVDIASETGQAHIRRLGGMADIVLENFKPGGLAKYGLDYAGLSAINPAIIYCSISGYGQTGPNRDNPGYDLMAQGFGGIMSLTGAPDGVPSKVGVGIADVMCGMYAAVGLLAALRHRDQTGEGQYIDLSLVDSQIAWLINEGVSFLQTGQRPKRRGNAHASIMPYDVYETTDGHVILAVGNDSQFRRFAGFIGRPVLADDPRFETNSRRLGHRDDLDAILRPILRRFSIADVISGLQALKVPVGPVLTLDQLFDTGQVSAREMVIGMQAEPGQVRLLGNPLNFSKTPVRYRRPPPRFGADTDAVLNSPAPFDE
ncbi:MAG: CoA transferase [Rhodobacteraceae bacterium]|nr:CoA transferase [Paracoccaceae bacterium]